VKSRTTERFRKSFVELPEQVQRQARAAYKRFRENPYHPSLHFKKISPESPIYSVRINIDHSAVGIREVDEMIWFWIGSHKEYEKLIIRL